MAFRGTESPMEFEWQGHGPMDSNSPFHRVTMDKQRKRTHTDFTSPEKPSVPSLREPNSQPWFFSSHTLPPPTATPSSPNQFRSPSFTTPRKTVDFDFSSGPESSPAGGGGDGQADDEETPNATPLPVSFTGSKSSAKRNSLFGIYGRFAPSPGRGEIKKPGTSDLMAKRIHKRRRKAQNFELQLATQRRRPSDDTSDDEYARPPSSSSGGSQQQQQKPDKKSRKRPQSNVEEVGWMTAFFRFIHTYPDAPSIIAKYLQVFFNAVILAGCLYMIWSFYATIQADVNRASDDAKADVIAEIAICARHYLDNHCRSDMRMPALETLCSNWETCMNRDPDQVKRARLGAHTFAEIFNSFVEPISLKTSIFTIAFILLGLLVNNATFTLYRRSQQHPQVNGEYRHPSASYMYPPAGMHPFSATSGQIHNQQQYVDWYHQPPVAESQQQIQKYAASEQPHSEKHESRSRSRSPEKKRLMMS